ncbi:ABC transporter permease [Priestia megaterium]
MISMWKYITKNITRNLSHYTVYILSSILSVAIFYMYAAFLLYPKVSGTEQLLIACEIIILLFSCFFIAYSHEHFLRERKKEMGIWKTFGASRKQLFNVLVLENAVVGTFSILVGILFGMLLSKIFFNFMSDILFSNQSFVYTFSPVAVFVTVILFGIVFLLVSCRSYFKIKRIAVLELFQEEKKPKPSAQFSRVKFILSICFLLVSYIFISYASLPMLLFAFLPLLALLLVGTYLFCSNGLVGVISYLNNKEKRQLNGIKMLTLISLRKRLYYNAKIIFIVSILLSAIMISIGAIQLYIEKNSQRMQSTHPQGALFVASKGKENKIEDIIAELKRQGIKDLHMNKWKGLKISSESGKKQFLVIQNDPSFIKDEDSLKNNNYIFNNKKTDDITNEILKLKSEKGERDLKVNNMNGKKVLNPIDGIEGIISVPKNTFSEIYKTTISEKRLSLYKLDFKEDAKIYNILKKLSDTTLFKSDNLHSIRLLDYENTVQLSSILRLTGLFICLVLFLALASLLWFKLYEDMNDDKKVFHSLRKVGLTAKEIKRTLYIQISVIFFVPLSLGGLNLFIATNALQNILEGITIYSIIVIFLIFGVSQFIIYLISSYFYSKKVL